MHPPSNTSAPRQRKNRPRRSKRAHTRHTVGKTPTPPSFLSASFWLYLEFEPFQQTENAGQALLLGFPQIDQAVPARGRKREGGESGRAGNEGWVWVWVLWKVVRFCFPLDHQLAIPFKRYVEHRFHAQGPSLGAHHPVQTLPCSRKGTAFCDFGFVRVCS